MPTMSESLQAAQFSLDVENRGDAFSPRHDESRQAGSIRSVFSIGGMTCASCTTSISQGVEALPGVQTVSVNLLGNSATVIHSTSAPVEHIIDTIGDVGFDAELIQSQAVVSDGSDTQGQVRDRRRTVSLRMKNGVSADSLTAVNATLSGLPLISFTPFSRTSPSATVTYRPGDSMNIRDLLQRLHEAAPGSELEIKKDQDMHTRSRVLQRRELRMLVWDLIAAVIFTIPTFIM